MAVPFDPREVFGQARPPVRGTVNGIAMRSRLAVYGETSYLDLTRSLRDAAGLTVGDRVDVVLELDDAPREVEEPAELRAALGEDRATRAAYDGLAFTHRREYARWVAGAKRAETRARRAAKTVEMVRERLGDRRA